MIKLSFGVSMVVVLLASACSDAGDDASTAEGGGAEGGAGGAAAGYTVLITGDWELDPFSEKTSDKHTLTIDRDIYFGAIRPIAPPGTHHTTPHSGPASSARATASTPPATAPTPSRLLRGLGSSSPRGRRS